MAALALLVIGAVLGVQQSGSAPLGDAPVEAIAEAATYLAKYGYSSPGSTSDRSGSLVALSDNIAEFQRFAGLEVTGDLNGATLEKMRLPRCGVKDKLGPAHRARRRRRYALQGSRWRIRALKYKIANWPKRLMNDKEGVRKSIRDAFEAWAKVSALTFQEVGPSEKAQIEIRFASGEHGDGDEFDGPGGTLAHAFFPVYGGDAHFDDDERWSVGNSRTRGSIDLFMTAAHEFGHSLGLSHSKDSKALMAPFYQPPDPNRNVVKEDDKLAIQELYGKPPDVEPAKQPAAQQPTNTDNTKAGNDPVLCQDSSVDAMLTVSSNKRTYVFKGSSYWRLTDEGVEKGYPMKIKDKWDGVPDNLDAIFQWSSTNRIYFFKGSQFWRMTNFKMDKGYPKLISTGFPGIPDNVDAAFQWKANGKVYFFKGSQYWRFDPSDNPPVSSDYPRPISTWQGVPNNLDSVITYTNGRTYFFKGGLYYKYDDVNFMIADSEIPYPRNTAVWWFGCTNQPSSLVTPPSRRGDIAAKDDLGDAVIGFGDGDAQPSRAGGAAAVLLPGVLPNLLASLLLLLPAALTS